MRLRGVRTGGWLKCRAPHLCHPRPCLMRPLDRFCVKDNPPRGRTGLDLALNGPSLRRRPGHRRAALRHCLLWRIWPGQRQSAVAPGATEFWAARCCPVSRLLCGPVQASAAPRATWRELCRGFPSGTRLAAGPRDGCFNARRTLAQFPFSAKKYTLRIQAAISARAPPGRRTLEKDGSPRALMEMSVDNLWKTCG